MAIGFAQPWHQPEPMQPAWKAMGHLPIHRSALWEVKRSHDAKAKGLKGLDQQHLPLTNTARFLCPRWGARALEVRGFEFLHLRPNPNSVIHSPFPTNY